jgi:sialidase-1
MMQDKNGRIHFLYCEDYSVNGGRVLRRYSDDDGITWSEPIDITSSTMLEYRNAFALGPGHGIMTKENVLVVPVWMVPKFYEAPENSHFPSVISTFYSKDNGESWELGEILGTTSEISSPNETVAALTSDGRVHLNIRFQNFCRAVAYSESGYSNWQGYAPDYNLPDPGCFGSVVAYNDGKRPYAMLFANCASNEDRKKVTIRASLDDGKTYPISKTIDEDRGGYVEIAVDNKAGLIYLVYETEWGSFDYIAIFDYDWLANDN